MVMRRYILIACCLLAALGVKAQYADFGKMSSMVRALTVSHRADMRRAKALTNQELCAFVRVDGEGQTGERLLASMGCRPLAHYGNIYIASIPVARLAALSLHPKVMRIEAHRSHSLQMDTTTVLMGGTRAHQGVALPQAFNGEGVLVGVEDIGFDLTHPNFYDATATRYRIKRFWDFLSTDTVGSALYVGADYTTEEALKGYAHSRDGLIQSHGTHTLGSAAGSGYNSPYRGMAPGSDICLVSNAVTEDLALIDSADVNKFTYATDCLGFKYIFDYADELGVPCVVSFSEGSSMDFRGDDMLYYEILDSLTGPGHILVASAGNAGQAVTHVRKPAEMEKAPVAIFSNGKVAYFSAKGNKKDYKLVMQMQGTNGLRSEYPVTVDLVYAQPDSVLADTVVVGEKPYYITASCYPSCFNSNEDVLEIILQTDSPVGLDYYAGVDLIGEGTEVELFRGAGYIMPSDASLGDNAYSLHSPSSAPSVISVGATGYRTGVRNYLGDYRLYDMGTDGMRSEYSSVGPTFDGRIKPDVMAPGTNVISSYSSYYIEASPEAGDLLSDVERFEFQGRTYSWNANSGTSMSTPVVAGAIALWLQAKPDLSPDDVIEVIRETSRHYDPNLQYPNNLYGYGEIDAYAGLLYILGISRIEGISHSQPAGVGFSLSGDGVLTMTFGDSADVPVEVRVYATSGTLMTKTKSKPLSGKIVMNLASLPHGVYAVQVNGPNASTTGSTLVRR